MTLAMIGLFVEGHAARGGGFGLASVADGVWRTSYYVARQELNNQLAREMLCPA